MIEVRWERGILLPSQGLRLDPRFRADAAFVSHAHSDHTGKHATTICTPATARLMSARLGSLPGTMREVRYGEECNWRKSLLSLSPAGHVLGSAQLLLKSDKGSLLYTGDFKVRPGLSCETAEFPRAETLIMETTFGRPRYVFPPLKDVVHGLLQFCRETLEVGDSPVLMGYSLGKAQEIMAALAEQKFPIFSHKAVAIISEVYREFGVELPLAEPMEGNEDQAGVFILPPHLRRSKILKAIPRPRVAVLSGWALDPGALYRYGCDAVFPLSDHADYTDLWKAVEMVSPRIVYTVHGFAEDFARDLRASGIEAWALGRANQLELGID